MDQHIDEDHPVLQLKDSKLQVYFFRMEKTLHTCHPTALHAEDTPSGTRTVARLARTCKAFNKPAKDVLWNELDSFLPLIGLFPHTL